MEIKRRYEYLYLSEHRFNITYFTCPVCGKESNGVEWRITITKGEGSSLECPLCHKVTKLDKETNNG